MCNYEVWDRFMERNYTSKSIARKDSVADCVSGPTNDRTTVSKRYSIGIRILGLEFLKLHADVYEIGRENAKRTNVCRKNGIIINDGRQDLGSE